MPLFLKKHVYIYLNTHMLCIFRKTHKKLVIAASRTEVFFMIYHFILLEFFKKLLSMYYLLNICKKKILCYHTGHSYKSVKKAKPEKRAKEKEKQFTKEI